MENPRAVFLENVENLVSHDKGETLKRIVTILEEELQYRIIGVTMDEGVLILPFGVSV